MLKWLATFLLIWFIYQVRHVFPPIIVGGIIAYLLLPMIKQLSQRTRLSTGLATFVVYLSIVMILVLVVWLIGPGIMTELRDLTEPENQYQIVYSALNHVAQTLHLQIDIGQTTQTIIQSVGHSVGQNVGKPEEIVHIGGLVSHGALAVLVCVVSSIYFMLDSESVGQFFLRYVPENKKNAVVELLGQMNTMLSRYVQGQIILITIMSVVAWLFLHFVVHMKYALPVALFSGFLEIIPVLGPIIATTIATLVGISQSGANTCLPGLPGLPGLLIITFYTIARWIEDYGVVPKIIGHKVALHPLAVIFAVLCGETLAGALGMLIAIPVAACIKLTLDYFYTGKLPAERRIPKKNPE